MKKKFTLYGLFSNRWGIEKEALEEDTTPTLKRFFKLFGRKFWNLITLNLMMFPMILPLLIVAGLYLGINKTPTAYTPLLAPLYGANMIEQTQESVFLLDLFGAPYQLPAFNATGTYIGMGVCALFLVVTFGWQNIGATYILRGLVRGDPIFPMSDYFYAIKRNLKQGFIIGIIDALLLCLFPVNIFIMLGMTGGFFEGMVFWMNIVIAIIYVFVRFYIYPQLVTFDLSIGKIFKNSFIFALIGWKRNILALFGIVVAVIINLLMLTSSFLIPLGIAMPLVILFAVIHYIGTYAAWFKIKQIMIDPYYTEPEEDEDDDFEPVFRDMG